MKGYESALFESLTGSDKSIGVQNVLGIRSGMDVVSWKLRKNMNSSELKKVCLVISAYCLLDVVAMLSGATVVRSLLQVWNSNFTNYQTQAFV